VKEFTNETRALLAFVLSLLILLVWSRYFKPPEPPAKPVPTQAEPKTPPAEKQAPSVSAVAALPVVGVEAENQEKTIVVESDLYRVELSNRGGVVRSWQLKKYKDDQNPPRTLDLVNAKAAQQLGGWPFSLALGDREQESAANSALYRVSPPVTALKAPAEVTFEWSDGHLAVRKKLKFAESYVVELETSVALDGRPLPAAIAWRGGFGDTTAYQAALQVNVFYSASGKLILLPAKKLGASGHPEERALQTGPLDYTGIEDKFFAAAFMPLDSPLQLLHWANERDVVQDEKPTKEIVAQMAAGASTEGPFAVRVYVGPKDLTQLNSLHPPLEELVQFGWFGIIAKPLLEILKWIYRFIPNYGWAIIFVTLAINMALFPLKVKSWRSMQRMQKVAPEVEALKQKYAKYSMKDPRKRKMNEEMMAIYQREGINPMGSCIPMLLQFPVWIAFYRMLGSAIELRHAPWILWIHDLSGRDPYFILTILMALTMWLMQKMTPQTITDPTQQKMMTLMPVMFGGMFFFFPVSCGLVLYIFTSNLVGIGQQWYLNRTDPLPPKGRSSKKR
jgi:YidC/Oxa1 family membrane protein insertase